MTEQQPARRPASNGASIAFFVLSCYLIANLAYRALVPAHEYPMRTAQIIEIAIDILCLVGLIGLRKSGPQWLFIVALIAGLGLFGIRMHSDASWWTGHWHYALSPR